ncbi:MAG: S8 family serine peptidase [Thermoplasmata archaeon]
MIGNGSSRAISFAVTIALVLSAFFALASYAAADAGYPAAPRTSFPDAPELAEEAAVEAASTTPGPLVGLTREGVRAWAEKVGVPSARLAFLPDERAPFYEIEATGGGTITPADSNELGMHKSDLANALGFDGTGVTVAVIDTGVDFAHPDLFNRTRRVMDAGSPYYLHPVAYDGASLNDYLVFGEPGPNSWWVNTSFSTTVVEFNATRWVNWTDGTTNLTWNVTGVTGLPAGEEVRIGFHPDDKLDVLLGMRPGVVLFNDAGAGSPFDSVMADLDGDFNLSDEKRAFINPALAGFDPEAELLFQDLDLDGVQDVSGGMLTFISDGVREIPYASRQIFTLNFTFQTLMNNNSFDIWSGLDPTSNLVPGDGNLTILFGDFDGPGSAGSHGTWVTSAIAGQGLTGGFGGGPTLSGHAPGAKIIGAGNNFGNADPFGQMGLWTAVIFASEGYDGVPDSGDEAQIASNSWGGGDWTGWEWGSRFVDYVSTILGDERILYVFAAGNSGPGMGGRQGPAGGASLLVSGAMENYFYRTDPWFGFDGGPNPSFGGTAYFSNRGPSALGRHYLDAMTSGMFGYGADPLNDNPFISDSGTSQDGNSSWVLWAGTSLSTPNLAGITALIYDAYAAAHGGSFPMAGTAKSIVKQSADDAGQDPTLTGAGIANALRGVLIANETDGITLDLNEWNPGDYRGVVYPGYTNILPAGGVDMATVTLTDHRPAGGPNLTLRDVTITDAVLTQTGSLEFNFTRIPGTGADEFLLNASGFMATNGTILVPGSAALWTSADSIRVSAYIGRQRMIDDIPAFRLRIFDWTDVNANGSFDGFDERNLITQNFISWVSINGPNTYMFLHDLANRVHDGLALRLDSFLDPSTPITINVVVDYFERADWAWLSSSVPAVMMPPGSSVAVDLMVSVPGEAEPGLYEAMFLFTLIDGTVTTLPVVVNVAASTLPFTFGDPSPGDSGHYQQGQTYGEWWGDDPIASGDWRYYFFDLPEAVDVTVLLGWADPLSHYGLYVLTNVPDWFSDNVMMRYGPGTEDTVAFTDISIDTGNGTLVAASLNAGLSIIAVQSVFIAGIGVSESPVGQVGVISLSPPSVSGVGVPVEDTETVTITSDLAFPDVQSFIESGSQLAFIDQPVDPFPPGAQPDFETYLFEAPNKLRIDIALGVSGVSYELFFHSGARDVDFGVFGDPDCDAVYTVGDIVGLAGTLANPERLAISNPTPGCHWVHVAGFDVDAGSLYDLTVTFVEQPVISATSIPTSIVPGVPASVTVAWDLPHVSQTFAGTVFFGSAQFPLAIPLAFSLLPDLPPILSGETPTPGAVIPDNAPTISLDYRDTPDAFESDVDPDSVVLLLDGLDLSSAATATNSAVTLALPFALTEGAHAVSVEVRDDIGSVNRTSWSFTIDSIVPTITITEPTVALTNNPVTNITGTTEPGAIVTINGTPVSVDSSGNFALLSFPLAEGLNSIPVVATDAAGSQASTTIEITVDTIAPPISLSSPADGAAVEVAAVTVTGTTEPGALVVVNGLAVDVDANGAFSLDLALSEGSNTITATATDPAGNSASTSRSVTYTDPVPGLQQDIDSANSDLNAAQGNLATLNTQILILIGLVVAAFVLAGVGFFLYWSLRRKPQL